MNKHKSILQIQEAIIDEYKLYVESFINIKHENIREVVQFEIEKGKLWPKPLIQFNPSFEYGESISSLVSSNLLHNNISKVFKGYKLFKHQVDAIKLGSSGKDFIVTSGTGSGKSLTYIGTIFNDIFMSDPKSPGIKAVIVYPMNALINSQTEELNRYKENYEKEAGADFPITFAQYTGQEKQEQRIRIRENPPDIILTNYMMLELILTRIQESSIRKSIYDSLKFLVFDELHTYRGRQGSDVALLIRRIKAKTAKKVLCIGTSATMVSGGSIHEQKVKVAEVATTFFGIPFTKDQVVNEELSRSFRYSGSIPDRSELADSIQKSIDVDKSEDELISHPLAIWLENRAALSEKDGILIRNKPLQLREIVSLAAKDSGLDENACSGQIADLLQWIANVNGTKNNPKESYLPFKLHQFISQTGSVYITLDQDDDQVVTLEPGVYKGKESDKKPLYPVVFSRASGHEFICVTKNEESSRFEPREFKSRADESDDLTAGYLIVGDDIWDLQSDLESLPDTWLKYSKSGVVSIQKKYEKRIPSPIFFDEFGNYSKTEKLKYSGWFMPDPLLFDPTSGTIYEAQTSEGTKLTKLGSEGRSTSTTITSLAILKHLGEHGYSFPDQKVLSFTDNRQDASLQAGHFNDFMKVVYLRSAIYQALAGAEGNQLDHSTLGQAIFDVLNIDQQDYAANPSAFPSARRDNENALKDYLVYRALYDLRRGWRVILPNLEQCGLLEIHYKYLEENCAEDEAWKPVPYFNEMSHEDRKKIIYQVLDFFRKSYAISSEDYLTQNQIAQKRNVINEKLKLPWTFDKSEKINEPFFLRYETIRRRSTMFTASVGATSALGKYLRSELSMPGNKINTQEYNELIQRLLELLGNAGWLKETKVQNANGEETKVYQLAIDMIIWRLGNQTSMIPDHVKNRSYKITEPQPNIYFQNVYKTDFRRLKKHVGREHSGQLNNEDRQEREDQFRSGEISALYCSPTMELGIDIATLNVVHMRNVPPNPANYAQRSGRAGRSGQAAFVFTYCSNYSPHDRHYFEHSTDMVAGVVAPPRIDLTNEELLYSHLNALYLAEVGLNELDYSIAHLVDEDRRDELPLQEAIKERIKTSQSKKQSIIDDFLVVTEDFRDSKLSKTTWFESGWINRQIDAFAQNLNNSINRWRLLYKTAYAQLARAQQTIDSGLYTKNSPEMKTAFRDQHQATRQRDLLKNTMDGMSGQLSEFYPYRYLASEGFLPGYNFTRLPLRVYMPIGNSGEYISRPRFVALREFGPRNIIYHNGSKYMMEQLVIQDAENNLERAKVSVNCGYILTGDDYDHEICPFSKVPLDSNESRKIYINLLEMSESKSEEVDRISCEEEERASTGFDIETYFSVPGGMESIITAFVKSDEEPFLKMQFIPAANLVQLNTKWRISKEDGFPIGLTTGRWKRTGQEESTEEIRRVQLYTSNTADALYIEPIKALALEPDGIITLQYALKEAIKNVFQIESNEIGVNRMGDGKHPNIFLYEASEGSLGILSQFVENKEILNKVIEEAIKLLRYDDTEYDEPASYHDLLSYYNQRDHLVIDRFLIKDALEKLKVCDIEIVAGSGYANYEDQYEKLMRAIDPNSDTEKQFLKYLYENGLRLPDKAQERVKGIYSQPDFWYAPDIWVFCDGTPHDKPEIKAKDNAARDAIRNKGEQVFIYYYKDSLKEITSKRPDIFKKVK